MLFFFVFYCILLVECYVNLVLGVGMMIWNEFSDEVFDFFCEFGFWCIVNFGVEKVIVNVDVVIVLLILLDI